MTVLIGSATATAGDGLGRRWKGRPLAPVSTRSHSAGSGLSNGTDTNANSRVPFVVARDHEDLVVEISNRNGWGGGSSPVTYKVAIETPAGLIIPVFFGTTRTPALDAGAELLSHPVGIAGKAGTKYWVRTRVVVAAADRWCLNLTTDQANDAGGYETGTATTDKVDSGTIPAVSSATAVPTISALLASSGPLTPLWSAGIGDSWYHGYLDSAPGDMGVFRRALITNNIPGLRLALTGETAQIVAAADTGASRRAAASGAERVFVHLGINDLTGSRTFAQFTADLLTIATAHANIGQKVIWATIAPKTTSTDAWATTVNQTTDASNPVRIVVNDWIRDGFPIDATTKAAVATGTAVNVLRMKASGHPLWDFVEEADTVESARNSGIYKVGMTNDGLHPGGAYATVAAAYTATYFAS